MYTASGKLKSSDLLEQYLPLVRRHALDLKTRVPASVDMDDLIQAGSIGLLDAFSRYDADQGAPFGSFASQRIRGAMIDELRSRDWVPRSVRRNARALQSVLRELEQALGRPPQELEIAQGMDMTLAEYRQLLLDTNGCQMMPMDDVTDDEIGVLSSNYGVSPFVELVQERNRDQLMKAVEALPERENLLLALYYQEKLNFKEIGAVIGVSESRVCQLHSQAVARLRDAMAD
ncbi:MAG: RNA polymerase sigma factor FliA [Pseudomonas sp.]|uniref:RNA polymerase sigma factor FliA n=1 Tax=Pseudomonas abieticivorans TaxID=2931382 RepID=UPI0020BD8DC4|nr:RNA polymerase sigma factor FliA [Pseudomonas sp. PIA16]MDE1168422.1 RNA polymerase sigma factor FliA [Pseudomonas sp.]